MSIGDIVLIIIFAAAMIAAISYVVRHHGSGCTECNGNCAACSKKKREEKHCNK